MSAPTLATFLRLFATAANHPGGADVWSGQPTKVEPPGPTGGFVPGTGGAAEYFNALFHGLAQPLAEVIDANWLGGAKIQDFTASGTFTTSDKVSFALVAGVGGGGGGGAGYAGTTTADLWVAGGGGGGGATFGIMPVVLAASTLYNVDIGDGGVGGGGSSTTGGDGDDGTNTTLRLGGSALAQFPGGKGGYGSKAGHVTASWAQWVVGGQPRSAGLSLQTGSQTFAGHLLYSGTSGSGYNTHIPFPAGSGGYSGSGSGSSGVVANSVAGSRASINNFPGGATGNKGGDVSTARGGGGGGGGGAGPFGAGGAGGHGATADSGIAPVTAASAAANTGAGGGGGGSGARDGVVLWGANGGAGGSGRLFLVTFELPFTP
jgi:hypothetical protein